MDISNFLDTMADVIDTNTTHVISFELRRLSPRERAELQSYLRTQAKNLKNQD